MIKRTVISVLISSFLSSPLLAAEQTYTLDPSHTNIVWSANHFGFSDVYGKFAKVAGTLTLDDAKPENSHVKVVVTMDSVISGVEKLDEHLKSDAFFDVAKFAEATFESTKVTVTDPGKAATVEGNLTLHGVTKPLTLKVTLNKMGESPITHKNTVGFNASAVIRRSEFGINFALPGVADDVPLTISTEAAAS